MEEDDPGDDDVAWSLPQSPSLGLDGSEQEDAIFVK
jgi:hypothetical protein